SVVEAATASAIGLFAAFILWQSGELLPTARLAPVVIASVVLVLAVVQVVKSVLALVAGERTEPTRRPDELPAEISDPSLQRLTEARVAEATGAATEEGATAGPTRSLLGILAILGLFTFGIWLLGFRVGSAGMTFA